MDLQDEARADVSAVMRPPRLLLGAGAVCALVSFGCWLVGGWSFNIAGYVFGVVLALVFAGFFDRIDNDRRRSAWYVTERWAGRANVAVRIAGLIAGILNLWAIAIAVAR